MVERTSVTVRLAPVSYGSLALPNPTSALPLKADVASFGRTAKLLNLIRRSCASKLALSTSG